MNESVYSGLCAQLKGSIKECFRGSTVGSEVWELVYGGKCHSRGHDGLNHSVCR